MPVTESLDATKSFLALADTQYCRDQFRLPAVSSALRAVGHLRCSPADAVWPIRCTQVHNLYL